MSLVGRYLPFSKSLNGNRVRPYSDLLQRSPGKRFSRSRNDSDHKKLHLNQKTLEIDRRTEALSREAPGK